MNELSREQKLAESLRSDGLTVSADFFDTLDERITSFREPEKESYSLFEVDQLQFRLIRDLAFSLAKVEGLAKGLEVSFDEREEER